MELSKAKITQYSSLSSKKMRYKYGMFVAEGDKCVMDMLGAFPLECLVATGECVARKGNMLDIYADKLYVTGDPTMRKMSSLSTASDIMAVFRIPRDEQNYAPIDNGKLYLMLDGIQDPGNLGTIIRTADWFGIDTVIASHDTADIYNPKTVQSTMGSLGRVNVWYADLNEIISENAGMPVYGMLLDGKNIYAEMQLEEKGFIIMGNEGNGISEMLRKRVTHPLLIPPYNNCGHAESLNVAIATAVTLSWFRGINMRGS